MKMKIIAAAAVFASAPSVAQAMDAHTFYTKGSALKKKGMGAMFSKDVKPLMTVMKTAGKNVKAENARAKAAGKPLYCPPPKPKMSSGEILSELERIPVSRRQTMSVQQAWREILRPLEAAIVAKTRAWLPNLSYPVRLGTHNQTAFAFGLMLDYARRVDDQAFEADLVNKALSFHRTDVSCPLDYEPSGEDFLSPCLMEADLMRRVLAPQDFAVWLAGFLPQIPLDGGAAWLEPGIVLDASDGKLVHLDGVNLSRAWALEGIADALPEDDLRIAALMASSLRHREVGIAAISDEHYSGSHWLASFATYLMTDRGWE